MVGLGSGAENHTLLLNLGISIHFRSTLSSRAAPFVTSAKQWNLFSSATTHQNNTYLIYTV